MTIASHPATRFRRTKSSDALRRLVRQSTLTVDDLIWPVFVREGEDDETPVPSMPGVARQTIDRVVRSAEQAASLGIPAICLFPYIETEFKNETCDEAWNPDNLSNRATRAIKAAVPEVAVMTDVALWSST